MRKRQVSDSSTYNRTKARREQEHGKLTRDKKEWTNEEVENLLRYYFVGAYYLSQSQLRSVREITKRSPKAVIIVPWKLATNYNRAFVRNYHKHNPKRFRSKDPFTAEDYQTIARALKSITGMETHKPVAWIAKLTFRTTKEVGAEFKRLNALSKRGRFFGAADFAGSIGREATRLHKRLKG